MSELDARRHTVPSGDDTPSRAGWVLGPLLTVRDPIPVANASDRAQALLDLAAEGITPSASQPIFFYRADAPVHARLEVVDDQPVRSVGVHRGKTTVTTASDGRATINHGLGTVPTAVIATLFGNTDGGATIPSQVVVGTGVTSTTFPIRVFTAAGTVYASSSITIAWAVWA